MSSSSGGLPIPEHLQEFFGQFIDGCNKGNYAGMNKDGLIYTSQGLINQAMLMLAAQPGALFIGQNVCYDGAWPYATLDGIPNEQRIEVPVCEELQMGMGIGLSLQGYLPILIYPRMDFLMRAMDQLVNHLDKLEQMSCGQYKPKVIIRTRVGPKQPLDAGPQHTQCHTEALQLMLTSTLIHQVDSVEFVDLAYHSALRAPMSTLVVEAF